MYNGLDLDKRGSGPIQQRDLLVNQKRILSEAITDICSATRGDATSVDDLYKRNPELSNEGTEIDQWLKRSVKGTEVDQWLKRSVEGTEVDQWLKRGVEGTEVDQWLKREVEGTKVDQWLKKD